MENHKLYRSVKQRVIGGVAGGLAEYFDIDPVIVRLVFVIVALAGGGGVLVYIILWIVLPENTAQRYTFQDTQPGYRPAEPSAGEAPAGSGSTEWKDSATTSSQETFKYGVKEKRTGGLIGGLVLITLGCLFLVDRFVPNIDFGDLWPILLVVIGAVIIATNLSGRGK
ncbi:MAG TPA: PspC domain-containing protein [Bacteroidales bacterium]